MLCQDAQPCPAPAAEVRQSLSSSSAPTEAHSTQEAPLSPSAARAQCSCLTDPGSPQLRLPLTPVSALVPLFPLRAGTGWPGDAGVLWLPGYSAFPGR